MARLVLLFVTLFLFVQDVRAEEIKLGAALALTGGVGGSWGTPELQGIRMAVEELNAKGGMAGRQIRLIVEDTKSDSPGTVRAVKKLIDVDAVDVLIGPTWLDSFAGAIPIIEAARVPTITPSAGSKTMNPKRELRYTFTMFPLEVNQFKTMLDVPRQLGMNRVAYVTDDDPYWNTFRQVLSDNPPEGIVEVGRETFPIATTDFRSWLTRVRKNSPQAIVGGFATQDATHAFLKQMEALNMQIPLISVDTLCEFRTEAALKDLLEGSICVYVDADFDPEFVKAFKEKFQSDPNPIASRGYDAVMVFDQALRINPSLQAINETLLKHPFQAASYGAFRFDDAHGVSAGSFVAQRLVQGTLVPLTGPNG